MPNTPGDCKRKLIKGSGVGGGGEPGFRLFFFFKLCVIIRLECRTNIKEY